MSTAVIFATSAESPSVVTVTCPVAYHGPPMTAITVTCCDGSDSTDVRYPPYLYGDEACVTNSMRRAERYVTPDLRSLLKIAI